MEFLINQLIIEQAIRPEPRSALVTSNSIAIRNSGNLTIETWEFNLKSIK